MCIFFSFTYSSIINSLNIFLNVLISSSMFVLYYFISNSNSKLSVSPEFDGLLSKILSLSNCSNSNYSKAFIPSIFLYFSTYLYMSSLVLILFISFKVSVNVMSKLFLNLSKFSFYNITNYIFVK